MELLNINKCVFINKSYGYEWYIYLKYPIYTLNGKT